MMMIYLLQMEKLTLWKNVPVKWTDSLNKSEGSSEPLSPPVAVGAGVLISAAGVDMWKGIKEPWRGRPQRQATHQRSLTGLEKQG